MVVLRSNVLIAVGAHPDDIELGCGGTISAASATGKKVIAVYLTKGEKSGDPKVRMCESKKALSILGVKDVFFGDFKDTEIPNSHEAIKFLEDFYDKYKPDTVLTHTTNDTHQDHRQIAWLSLSAFRNVSKLLAYETPRVMGHFAPNYFDYVIEFIVILIASLVSGFIVAMLMLLLSALGLLNGSMTTGIVSLVLFLVVSYTIIMFATVLFSALFLAAPVLIAHERCGVFAAMGKSFRYASSNYKANTVALYVLLHMPILFTVLAMALQALLMLGLQYTRRRGGGRKHHHHACQLAKHFRYRGLSERLDVYRREMPSGGARLAADGAGYRIGSRDRTGISPECRAAGAVSGIQCGIGAECRRRAYSDNHASSAGRVMVSRLFRAAPRRPAPTVPTSTPATPEAALPTEETPPSPAEFTAEPFSPRGRQCRVTSACCCSFACWPQVARPFWPCLRRMCPCGYPSMDFSRKIGLLPAS